MIELDLAGARVRFTARAGGVSESPYDSLNIGALTADLPDRVASNVQIACSGLPVVQLRQVHGMSVVHAQAQSLLEHEADAAVTQQRGLALLATTADCMPIALATESTLAVVHAGWRGLVDGVIEAALDALHALEPGATPAAALGPCARACCYEVGLEVAGQIGEPFVTNGLADLPAAAVARMQAAGVVSVSDVGTCTMCEPDRYFSHRRSGPVTGRQGVVAWLK